MDKSVIVYDTVSISKSLCNLCKLLLGYWTSSLVKQAEKNVYLFSVYDAWEYNIYIHKC